MANRRNREKEKDIQCDDCKGWFIVENIEVEQITNNQYRFVCVTCKKCEELYGGEET